MAVVTRPPTPRTTYTAVTLSLQQDQWLSLLNHLVSPGLSGVDGGWDSAREGFGGHSRLFLTSSAICPLPSIVDPIIGILALFTYFTYSTLQC